MYNFYDFIPYFKQKVYRKESIFQPKKKVSKLKFTY